MIAFGWLLWLSGTLVLGKTQHKESACATLLANENTLIPSESGKNISATKLIHAQEQKIFECLHEHLQNASLAQQVNGNQDQWTTFVNQTLINPLVSEKLSPMTIQFLDSIYRSYVSGLDLQKRDLPPYQMMESTEKLFADLLEFVKTLSEIVSSSVHQWTRVQVPRFQKVQQVKQNKVLKSNSQELSFLKNKLRFRGPSLEAPKMRVPSGIVKRGILSSFAGASKNYVKDVGSIFKGLSSQLSALFQRTGLTGGMSIFSGLIITVVMASYVVVCTKSLMKLANWIRNRHSDKSSNSTTVVNMNSTMLDDRQ
jgi:hypothetical protein